MLFITIPSPQSPLEQSGTEVQLFGGGGGGGEGAADLSEWEILE